MIHKKGENSDLNGLNVAVSSYDKLYEPHSRS